MCPSQNNYDLVDYVNTLREGILEAYTGIIGGLKTGGKVEIMLPYINDIFAFLHLVLTDQDRTEAILRSAIGLLGDLAEAFPNGQLKDLLSSSWVADLLKAGRTKMGGSETKKVAKWAREVRPLSSARSHRVLRNCVRRWFDARPSSLQPVAPVTCPLSPSFVLPFVIALSHNFVFRLS